MKVLLTGASGYISMHLLPVLLNDGHEVVCLVRNEKRFRKQMNIPAQVDVITGDMLKELTFPLDIDAAYYMVNKMPSALQDFHHLEILSTQNFIRALKKTSCEQIIYLTGIINGPEAKKHTSQLDIESVIKSSGINFTILRSSVIIGKGSAYFEIIHDLVNKLHLIISSNWINYRCQPIALADVIEFLKSVLLNEKAIDATFDIGGPEVLSYKEMIREYIKIAHLRRKFLTFPIGSHIIASYWLKTITSLPYGVARELLSRMRYSMICSDNHNIQKIIPRNCIRYSDSLKYTLEGRS